MKKIELLAPARDTMTAKAAIDCGADAVYMGAPRFGARQAAGNSIEDIADAAKYAHIYGARLYVTLNTLLFDDELREAEKTARQAIEAGADALIVQDMAYMEMGLEGVEFHASTQTFNATPEKVRFLGGCGFSRVVLERGLSLEEIKAIRAASDAELECFVHGALCVCYSGRCYMSRTLSRRSGNRGDCSQPCRLPYDLLDSRGNMLAESKHLLSLKDLNLSERVGDLLDAGVTSFKIEGRLKDISYVRNTVAWYSRRLDEELEARSGLVRASVGRCETGFTPDIAKTFSRGYTEYFFGGRRSGVSSPDTPKAVGTFVGKVACSGSGWVEIRPPAELNAGDGICFMSDGVLTGTNVNGSEGNRVEINRNMVLPAGTDIYRNYDHRFNIMLEGCKARRTIGVTVAVSFGSCGIEAVFRDEAGLQTEAKRGLCNGAARNPGKMLDIVREQLSRSGDTVFHVTEVIFPQFVMADAADIAIPFARLSELNGLRREGLERLYNLRAEMIPARSCPAGGGQSGHLHGLDVTECNVTNSLARRFYSRFGMQVTEEGYDLRSDLQGVAVMKTPFCIRRERGQCPKTGAGGSADCLRMRHGKHHYRLEFDCKECMMSVVYEGTVESLRDER